MEGLLRALSASSENDGGADLLGKQSDDSDKAEEKSNRLDGTEGEAEHGFDLGSVDRLAREMEDLSVDKVREFIPFVFQEMTYWEGLGANVVMFQQGSIRWTRIRSSPSQVNQSLLSKWCSS